MTIRRDCGVAIEKGFRPVKAGFNDGTLFHGPGFVSPLISMVGNPERCCRSGGAFFIEGFFIFLHVQENGSKGSNAHVPLHPARHRSGRSTRKLAPPSLSCGGTQTVRALLSVRPADARRGTKGNLKTNNIIFKPYRGGYLRSSTRLEEIHGCLDIKIFRPCSEGI